MARLFASSCSGLLFAAVGLFVACSGSSALAGEAAGAEGRTADDGGAGTGAGFSQVFIETCAVCHGERLEGAAQGTPLTGVDLIHGDSMAALISSISEGYPEQGMPAWSGSFSAEEIKSLALFISEVRGGMLYSEFHIDSELSLPEEAIASELHRFRVEPVIDGLDPLPYSIAPLPDGGLLLTEKMRGLSIVSAAGEQSPLIEGTPRVYADSRQGPGNLMYGQGWLLDVALHPDYADNGWVYLHYTDRCRDCNTLSREMGRPVSMNALVRGRIRAGRWEDEETIWKADIETYSPMSDVTAGGRIAFDPEGYVFISIGAKGMGIARGVQNLQLPYGKTHRVHDDGRIPTDNPFIDDPDAANSIWTYGHRSPQGLEFDQQSRQLWGSEHGPRGGDEINLLSPGGNFGWPLYSKGQNYNGSQVDWGSELGIEFELDDIEQPVVDLTPSPAVSSFVFYRGSAFPAWQDQLLVGSLKAATLYRMKIVDNKFVHKEALIEDLARIRDVEIGAAGEVYLLLEHASGGRIVKIVPAEGFSGDG